LDFTILLFLLTFFGYPLKEAFSSFFVFKYECHNTYLLILVSNYSAEGNKTTIKAKLREHPKYKGDSHDANR